MNLLKRYMDAKGQHPNAVLLFRVGDFYELFYEDAEIGAKVLGLTLTTRGRGNDSVPMAGFPHHQFDGYVAKLVAEKYRVAVLEQAK